MGKTARNERRKLTATLLNAIGIAILGAALVVPAARIAVADNPLPGLLLLVAAAIGLHGLGRLLLRRLED